jgi:hypothetical protein
VLQLGVVEEKIMLPKYRIVLSAILTIILAAALVGVGGFDQRLSGSEGHSLERTAAQTKGVVQVFVDGVWVGGFTSSALGRLPPMQFDPPDGAAQISGWSLGDALLLLVSARQLKAETRLTVVSQRQKRSLLFTWGQVNEGSNSILLRKSEDGALDLFANLPQLDRSEQQLLGVDRIELTTPKVEIND